jgi:hypothetical protein
MDSPVPGVDFARGAREGRSSMWCFDPAYETGPAGAERTEGWCPRGPRGKVSWDCDRYRRRAALHDLPLPVLTIFPEVIPLRTEAT